MNNDTKDMGRQTNGAHLCTLQIHIIIPDLKIYTKYVDERHIIAAKGDVWVRQKGERERESKNGAHITVCGRTSHHEFDGYSEKPTGF